MAAGVNIDGVLVTWGDRLFYPGNRMVKGSATSKLTGSALRRRADFIRARIAATVRRAPQVMVKVTGGGRGMRAIAAHFRYISKNGKLDIEDDRGEVIKGANAVRDLAEDWRFGGGLIPEDGGPGGRREAFNIMLSMPRGTDPLAVQRAAREFARVELAGHKYVMVLHDHQANPHVHISVRAEGRGGRRLNPRKADLHRWRELFAEKLRELGVDAEATQRTTRGATRTYEHLWRAKAREAGRLRNPSSGVRSSTDGRAWYEATDKFWRGLQAVLEKSSDSEDRLLAARISTLRSEMSSQQQRETSVGVDVMAAVRLPSRAR
jgi:hypothetical protein